MKHSNKPFLLLSIMFLMLLVPACVSSQNCGNEIHVAKNKAPLRLSFSSNSSCGNESHLAKKKKVRKKDMGLYGRGENPYRRR
jgi:hypothetical protein